MKLLESFNAADKASFLELAYMLTIWCLLSAVVFTPVFIRHHFFLFKNFVIKEDILEAVLIILLLLLAYLLSKLYKNELKKYLPSTDTPLVLQGKALPNVVDADQPSIEKFKEVWKIMQERGMNLE